MTPLVHVLVLNWNAHAYTEQCVRSLQQLDYPNYRIVVIDNASEDGSEQILRSLFPELTLIQTGANLGYAGGNNCGVAYALQQGAQYIWVLNNDTRVDPHSLSALVAEMEQDPQVGMAGSKIFYMDRPDRIAYAGGYVDFWRGKPYHRGVNELDDGQYDRPEPVDFITGCSLLVRSACIAQVGTMTEDYFLYCEDVEWNLRFRKAGFKRLFVPTSVLWHKESASAGGGEHPNVVYYNARNRLYLFEQFSTLPRLTATVRYTLWHFKFLALRLFGQRTRFPAFCLAVFEGYRDYLKRVTGPRRVAAPRGRILLEAEPRSY